MVVLKKHLLYKCCKWRKDTSISGTLNVSRHMQQYLIHLEVIFGRWFCLSWVHQVFNGWIWNMHEYKCWDLSGVMRQKPAPLQISRCAWGKLNNYYSMDADLVLAKFAEMFLERTHTSGFLYLKTAAPGKPWISEDHSWVFTANLPSSVHWPSHHQEWSFLLLGRGDSLYLWHF